MHKTNRKNLVFSAPILAPDVKQQLLAINGLDMLRLVIGGASMHENSFIYKVKKLFCKNKIVFL